MKIIKDKMIFSFNNNNPYVEKVKDGETVIFETRDCFNNQLTSDDSSIGTLDWDCINPATGPVYVENATVNDTLKIEILKIELGNIGVMCALPDMGVLGSKIKEESIKRIKVENEKVYF
ncbi:MAG: acetamidase, partial [Erysipelotrichaceae bacterium]|nr:acetamidase [Erysipelotrichaceae bacterium]